MGVVIDANREERLKELYEEEERIRKQINDICFINCMNEKEKDELWTLILNLIDNQIEIEKDCNV